MRKILMMAGILALAAVPASAAGFGIHGSFWDPDAIDDAAGGGAFLAFPLGDSNFDLGLRGTFYQEADFDDFGGDDEEVFRDFGLQMIPLEAVIRYNFLRDSPFNPYIGGGATYTLLEIDDGPDLDDEVGWVALLGTRFGDLGGTNFFVEGGWRATEGTVRSEDLEDFFDDDNGVEDDFDEDVDIELDGAFVNVGVVWNFG